MQVKGGSNIAKISLTTVVTSTTGELDAAFVVIVDVTVEVPEDTVEVTGLPLRQFCMNGRLQRRCTYPMTLLQNGIAMML